MGNSDKPLSAAEYNFWFLAWYNMKFAASTWSSSVMLSSRTSRVLFKSRREKIDWSMVRRAVSRAS